jgi:hypothetical protein
VLRSPKEYNSVASTNFFQALAAKGVQQVDVAQRGEVFTLGAAAVRILWAENAGSNTESANVNNSSVMLKITLGEKSFLFTGDCQSATEGRALTYWAGESGAFRANVLKVGHHGSGGSSTQNFLNAVQPSYSSISCGAGNSYGHPAADALTRLWNVAGNQIVETDINGTVTVTTDGSAAPLGVSVQKGSVPARVKPLSAGLSLFFEAAPQASEAGEEGVLYQIDRFEGGFAVLVDIESGETKTVLAADLPDGAAELDMLAYEGGRYTMAFEVYGMAA